MLGYANVGLVLFDELQWPSGAQKKLLKLLDGRSKLQTISHFSLIGYGWLLLVYVCSRLRLAIMIVGHASLLLCNKDL